MLQQVGPFDGFIWCQLKICDSHLRKDTEALEAIMWYNHSYIDNCRQCTNDRCGDVEVRVETQLHVDEPLTNIPSLLCDKSFDAESFRPRRASHIHAVFKHYGKPDKVQKTKADQEQKLFQKLALDMAMELISVRDVQLMKEC